MANKEYNCNNHCPKCDSDDIMWTNNELESEFVMYAGNCNKCGTQFEEEHTIVYKCTTIV